MPNNLYFITTFAQDGDKTPVPDGALPSGSVSYDEGYPTPYSLPPDNPSALLIDRAQYNQILNDITAAIQFIQQNGAPAFITTAMNGGVDPFSYALGVAVAYDAGSGLQIWVSTAADNITIPGDMGADWTPQGAPQSEAPGSIKMWGSTTAPAGFLECDGSAVSRTTYVDLFDEIGTTFGGGDGTTTFNIPDFRGYFPRGWAHGSSIDSGRAFGTDQVDLFKTHTHVADVTDPEHSHHNGVAHANTGNSFNTVYGNTTSDMPGSATTAGSTTGSAVTQGNTSTVATDISVLNENTGGAETRPVNLAVMFIIKT